MNLTKSQRLQIDVLVNHKFIINHKNSDLIQIIRLLNTHTKLTATSLYGLTRNANDNYSKKDFNGYLSYLVNYGILERKGRWLNLSPEYRHLKQEIGSF